MKSVSPALLALLNSALGSGSFDFNGDFSSDFSVSTGFRSGNVTLVQFDLYTINLFNGGTLLFTTADFPIQAPTSSIFSAPKIYGSGDVWFSGMQWLPRVLDVEGSKTTGHWKVGLDTDQWTFELAPQPFDPVTGAMFPETIGAVPFLAALRGGVLDTADVIVSRAYFAQVPTWPLPAGGAIPIGTTIIFRGVVGEVDLTTSSALITLNDYKSLLSMQMPRNLYQSGCRHQLYDSRCTLSSAGYTQSGSAASGSSRGSILSSASIAAPSGSGTYALGRLVMTSGLNAGFSRLVTSWSGGVMFSLLNPFPFNIATGDTFTVSAGCDKQMATCSKFNNLANFGGEPFIPMPDVSLG